MTTDNEKQVEDVAEAVAEEVAEEAAPRRRRSAKNDPCPYCGGTNVKDYDGGDVNPHKIGTEECPDCNRRIRR